MFSWLFGRKRLEQEAFYAYYNRLPDSIKVKWQRSNGMIVGVVYADDFSFGVQERDPSKFVDVVNEGVLLAYDTPKDYLGLLLRHRKFNPPAEDWRNLNSEKKKRATMSLELSRTTVDELVAARG
jgi:hypothetical protein